MMWSDFMLGRYHVCPKTYTQPLSHLYAYLKLFQDFGHHKDALMILCTTILCRPHQGCLLTSTYYCTCDVYGFIRERYI